MRTRDLILSLVSGLVVIASITIGITSAAGLAGLFAPVNPALRILGYVVGVLAGLATTGLMIRRFRRTP